MAYLFDVANYQYLEWAGDATARGVTSYSVRFRLTSLPPSGDHTRELVSVGYQYYVPMQLLDVYSDGSVRAIAVSNSGEIGVAQTDAGLVSAGQWCHAAAVFAGATSRSVYLNGGNKKTDTTQSSLLFTYNRLRIGARANIWGPEYSHGDIADVGIWSAALTDDEIAALAMGASPLLVRPTQLWFYAPLVRNLNDYKQGLTLTGYGTGGTAPSVSNHSRIFQLAMPLLAPRPGADDLTALTASGASTSAGAAVLHLGLTLKASGASSSSGRARMTVLGANTVTVTQAGALVDVARTVPVRATQAGALIDATRIVPVQVTQAGATVDASRIVPVQVTQAGAIVDTNSTVPVNVSQAGLMIDARYRRPESLYNCWEFHVYKRDGTYLAYLDNAFQTAYLEQLNECGGGAFVLPAGDAKATPANLTTGNVVRPRYRNVEIGAFTIDDVEEVLIAEGEGQAQLLKISGRGLIGTLDHGLVYPGDVADPATAEREYASEAKAAIWLALYNEFIARGGGELNMGFTDVEDSAGLTWGDTVSIKFRAGQTLLDVLRQLSSLGMDVTVDPDRTMLAYATLGRDLSSTVVFRKGLNILSSTKKTLGSDLANAVLGAGQDVLVETTDATSLAAYGRREAYLPVQNTADSTLVTTANGLLLGEYKDPRTAITLEVTARELFPFFDYDIGDTVRVVIPEEDGSGQEIDADYRIYSISMREGQGPCDLRVTLELNSLEAEYLIKLQKALRASLLSVPPSSGSAASLASSSTATPATTDGGNLGPDSVGSVAIDWGTGTGQVSAADVPLTDAGTYFATDNVEAALQQLGAAAGTIVTDHGGMAGLADDDHTQYLLADGTRAGANAGGAQQFVGGLRVGGDTNYFYVTSGGEVSLNGAATQWDDLRVAGSQARPGVTAPTLGAFGPSGNLRTLRFDAGQHDEIEFEIQMPHSWKLGSKLYPHVHWAPVSATTGNVVWELEYAWANADGTFGAPSSMASDAQAAGGMAWVHKLAPLKSGGNAYIDGTGKTLSSMLVCRLHRNAGSGSDTLNADVAFLEFDIHYEVDSFGSNEEYTK